VKTCGASVKTMKAFLDNAGGAHDLIDIGDIMERPAR
jgi:hypothetical protein